MLVPNRGRMADPRQAVGGDRVRTRDGELEGATLRGAMAWATTTPRDPARLLRDHRRDRDEIARQTVDAYDAVRRRSEARERVRFRAEA